VSIRRHPGADRSIEPLFGTLVIDAGGRASKAPQWLKALGYPAPEETVITAFIGYASRLYRRPAIVAPNWQGLLLQWAPPEIVRGGVIFPVERDRWMVTLVGGDKDYPPTEEADFLAFSRSLRVPLVHQAIEHAQPLSPIYGYRSTENRLRHYERLTPRLEGFLAVGDAVCMFNPVYGQGMTTAAIGALALDSLLRERQWQPSPAGTFFGLADRYQKMLAKLNADPWLLATSQDLRFRTAAGGAPTLVTRLMYRYLDRVTERTTNDREVRQVALEMYHMIKPASALFQPKTMIRVFWSWQQAR
jgi:flavin-dependent dehydrogenase